MKAIDALWKCSPEEVVKKSGPTVTFCGICIQRKEDGYFIHQRPYIKDLLKKYRLEECNATKIILDKESDDADKSEEEETEEWKQWKESPEFTMKVREAQKIAGEVLWLTTRTRPDLCYPIQKMTSISTRNPEKALKYGFRMLRYLKGTENHGLKYVDAEATKGKFKEQSKDWPAEVYKEGTVCVWTDSSFAPQKNKKCQGALVVTQIGSPIFWKCGVQALIATSTAESELQMLVKGSLAAQNVGMMVKEMLKPIKKKERRLETIKELEEREEFAEDTRDEDQSEEPDVLCVDNKAATQILDQ